ncbi:MAG: hypothetical protein RLY70_4559 [Planctomycetota bacterium]
MIVPRRLANRSPQTAQPPEGGLTPALGLSTCVSRACRIWGNSIGGPFRLTPARSEAIVLAWFGLAAFTTFAAFAGLRGPAYAAEPAGTREAEDWFEQRVRPLLAAKCLECHGEQEPEAGLSLVSRAAVLQGGDSGPAAVPGQPAKSLLVEAVRRSGRLQMPPTAKLRDEEIAVLTRWVELGLPWPAAKPGVPASKIATGTRGERQVTVADRQHWSFQPPVFRTSPAVGAPALAPTTVDRFVLAKLEHAGLRPAVETDRRTLLRRVHYDLVGLPPSWEEVQDFEQAPGPLDAALARVVDRLLASPRHGERWARHWLDVARFADTKDGVLMYGDDRIRPYAYTYRDYVIRAFNEDLPYDRFVHEQLAADLIEPPVEPWRLAAMGLLTLGRMYDNNIHDIIDDQIDVATRGFLGLTVACARCHDHKYDPIPQADYYSLYGVFANSEAPFEPPLIADPASMAGGAEFEAQCGPKRAELRKFLDEQFELLSDTARKRTPDYLIHVATTKPDPLETAIFFLSLAPDALRPPIIARWRRLIAERSTADDPVFAPWRELMAIDSNLDGTRFAAQAAERLQAFVARPAGTAPGQANPLVRDGLKNATLASHADVARVYGELLVRAAATTPPVNAAAAGTTAAGTTAAGNATAGNAAAGNAAVQVGAPSGGSDLLEAARQQLADCLNGPRSPAFFPKSQTRRYMSRQQTDAFGGKLKEIDLMAVRSPAAPPRAMSLQDSATPSEPRIFTRGNPSQPGRTVPRQFLAIASPEARVPFGPGSGRLDLARALTAPGNPLTARVLVNRVWMVRFQEPLVGTPSDFGVRAPLPEHHELLDRLAIDLTRGGWSLKRLHRELLLTRLYRQAAEPVDGDRSGAVDPENRLLARAPRRRLDFEAMRDTLLAASGRLQQRSGGRPVDVAVDANASVRTVYALVDRQSLPGLFRAFDFASPDQSIERRPRTMVPQQALFALNSPLMLTQAQALAERSERLASETAIAIVTTKPSANANAGQSEGRGDDRRDTSGASVGDAAAVATDARIRTLYRLVYAREPSPDELADCREFIATVNADAWRQLAQTLLSANELMYLD